MATTATFREIPGRTHKSGSSKVVVVQYYILSNTNDSDDVMTVLEDVTDGLPQTYGGLPLKNIDLDDLDGRTQWLATATYSAQGIRITATGTEEIYYRGGASQKKMTASLETKASYGASPPDYENAMNVVTENGVNRVEGADTYFPEQTMMVVEKTYSSEPSTAEIKVIAAMQCMVNNATFKGWLAGELLFLTYDEGKVSDSEWKITFTFLVSANAASLDFGGISIAAGKLGHEEVWGRFELEEDGGVADVVLPHPVAAYVERKYYTSTFTDLGLSASE